MSDILIRAREPTDMADITELLNQPRAIWGTLQMPFVSLEARQKRASATGGDLHLVAVLDGKTIGSASLNRFDNRRAGFVARDSLAGRLLGLAGGHCRRRLGLHGGGWLQARGGGGLAAHVAVCPGPCRGRVRR